jgi:hypothetical protein
MFCKARYILLGIVSLGLPLIALFGSTSNQPAETPLVIRIANFRGLVGVGRDYDRHQLYAVVTNVSDQPVRIWDQWNSWGYHNLTLTLDLEGGDQKHLRRFGGENWHGNAADAIELGPGEHYIFAVWLKPDDRRVLSNSWGPIRVRNGDYPWATLTAHYEIRPDGFADKRGVWVGRVSSKPVRLRLKDETGETGIAP